jgi:hypothetical protein
LYDKTGSYDIVWYLAIALGVFAALVNLPVRESPIQRPTPQTRMNPVSAMTLRPKPSLGRKIAVASAVSAGLIVPFWLYTQPDLVIMLAEQLWTCF